MIKVGIVDDHTLFRKSLEDLVNDFEDMKVFLVAENGSEALLNLRREKVDVLLLDVQMPIKGGIETAKTVKERYPEIKIIGLSALDNKGIIGNMLKSGVSGYLTKNAAPETLERAIRNVYEGGMFFDKGIKHIIENILTMNETEMEGASLVYDDRLKLDFSEREMQIIQMVSEQKSNEEIGKEIGKSIRTIENYRRDLINKTRSKNFIGVIIYAIKNGNLLVSDLETNLVD